MKLLILTQKIDIKDDVLGFFHNWVKEFSQNCGKITVVALGVGEYNLPENVKVLSLGKERGSSKIKYILNFYKYIWRERKNYDKVFIHMNQEYVVLGGLLWKIFGKKIFLWRNHAKGDFFTDLAVFLSNKVFCTSGFSYTAKFSKTKLMPAGIETDYFVNLNHSAEEGKINLLFLGRISPVKDLETLIKSLAIIRKEDEKFFLNIIGEASERDNGYFEKMRKLVVDLGLEKYVKFWGRASYGKTLEFYNRNDVFINLTKSGSFDKTILEAMSCEKMVLTCNQSFLDVFPKDWRDIMIFKEEDPEDLAEKITSLCRMAAEKKSAIVKESRRIVKENHSLNVLAKKLFQEIK
ncbi:MAG: glycosyltransferase family 4 protein [Patescibacteria group bacterium]